MIALILMCSFKLLYPDAFTFNVTVNGSVIDSGSSDDMFIVDLFYLSYIDFFNGEGLLADETGGSYTGFMGCGDVTWANANKIVCNAEGYEFEYVGEPYCYIADELFYIFETPEMSTYMGFDVTYPDDVTWFCNGYAL